MADIDSIISGVGGNTRADFSGLGDIPKAYWEGLDQRAKNDLRDAFKGGLPMKGDQIDWPTVTKKFFSVGAIDQGIAAAGQGLAQQKMEYGQKLGQSAFPSGDGAPPSQQPQPGIAPTNAPSPSRTIQGQVAPSLNKGGEQDQVGQSGTLMQVLTAQGIPNDQLGAASAHGIPRFVTLPRSGQLSGQVNYNGPSFLGAACEAFETGEPPRTSGQPLKAPPGLILPLDMPPARLRDRLALATMFNRLQSDRAHSHFAVACGGCCFRKAARRADATKPAGYPVKSEVVQGWLTSQGGAGHGRLSRGWTRYSVC
jgi:hypothetical protein